jgi:YjjG family noncanonical pyrimidine nucleotidase
MKRKNEKMKYRYLLFDADGTLFDFEKSEQHAFSDTMEKFGIPYTDWHYRLYSSINLGYWKMLEKKMTTKEELVIRRYRDYLDRIGRCDLRAQDLNNTYIARLGSYCFLFPQSLPLCRELSKKHTLLLVTNGVYSTQISRFDLSAIKPYFTEMIVSEKIGFTKPDPRYFDYIFEKYSISDKSQALIIGDSLTADIKGGRDYGIDTCFYNPSGAIIPPGTCTYEISQLNDLLRVLDE